MKFLQRNKKVLSTKILSESDYFVLTYEQLIMVNGAGSSSKGGTPAGPSNSGNLTDRGYPSSTSGYNTGYSSFRSKYVENSNSGIANANVGDKIIRKDGSIVTLTQGDIDWAKSKVNSETTSTSSTTTTTTPTTTTTTNKTATDKIESAIANVGKKSYTDNYRRWKCILYMFALHWL